MHRKHNAFLCHDRKKGLKLKKIKNKKVRFEIERAKLYQNKIKGMFHSNDLGWWDHEMVWRPWQEEKRGIIWGQWPKFDLNSGLANVLNDFYLRFNDEHDFTENHCDIFNSLNYITVSTHLKISAISVKHNQM